MKRFVLFLAPLVTLFAAACSTFERHVVAPVSRVLFDLVLDDADMRVSLDTVAHKLWMLADCFGYRLNLLAVRLPSDLI